MSDSRVDPPGAAPGADGGGRPTHVLAAALATGLAGGALHTALALGAAPRALASFGRLLGPTAVAVGVLSAVALVLFLVVPPLAARLGAERSGATRGDLRAALGTALVALAALHPLFAGGRGSGLALAWAATAVLAGLAVLGLARGAGPRARALLVVGVPLASLFVLAAAWARTYSSAGLGLALAVVALGALLVSGRMFERVPALPVLFALAGAVAASGAGGLLRGDGDLRNHHARRFDDGRPSPIVLVTVDTLRPDFLSRARADGAETPTLDALFADSVVFDHARASAPWTKPSVATILTGLSPLVHGTTNRRVRLPAEAHTLAEHLQDAGYVTAGMGLNVHLEPFFGFAQGFDQYWFPVRDDWGGSLGAELLREVAPKRYPALFPTTEALADVAVAWLDDNADRDFFLWIHFLDPHWPYEPPAEHLPARAEGQRIGARWGDEATVREVQAGVQKLGEPDRERVRALYRGEIEYVDAELERVFAKLRELGLYDDALVAFTSDHGEEFWEHGTFEHGHTLYDEVLRVPLALKLPGAGVRTRVDADVSNEALVPTLLELARIEPRHPLSARSLTRFWRADDAAPEVDDALAAGTYYYAEKRMLLHDGLKLIVDHDTGGVELYDLRDDPAEARSFGPRDPRVPELLERLHAREGELEALRDQLGLRVQVAEPGSAAAARMGALGYGGGEEERPGAARDADEP